jgi:phosphoglycolate phosphatase|tara:strand:- start:92 stop:712 length:621 start_codon:yes stop_codon:yes gene_type:complete
MKNKIKLVLFDLDGVLINSISNMKFSWDKVNEKYRLKIPFKKYYNFIGIPFNDILKNLGIKKNLHSLIFKYYSLHSSKNINKIKLYPNVKKTVKILNKKKIILGIVTSKDFARSKKILQKFNLRIKNLYSPSKYLRGKPHPDQLLLALKLNKILPKNTLFVGDTKYDYLASKKAKIPFVFASYGYGVKSAGYNRSISKLDDLLNFI